MPSGKTIVIMADSLRRDHVGCYGNDWIRTPNLDAFAADAVVFEQAYQSSHPTIPNRTDLFTGRWNFPWYGWEPLDRDELVLSEILGENGVHTELFADTYHLFKEGFYFERGFDGWWWVRGQEGDRLPQDATIPIVFPCAPEKVRQPYPDRYPNILRNRRHRRIEEDWLCPQLYLQSMRWLERNYMRDSFLLWIDGFDPHEPWDPPAWYIDLYDAGDGLEEDCDYPEGAPCDFLTEAELRRTRARYAGEVTMVDTWFGHLMNKLADLGIADECMILFLSDHGHWLNYPGDGGNIGKNLSWQGQQFPMYQTLVNVPFIARVPGGAQGERAGGYVQPPDALPTILDWVGIETPERCHGLSFLPMLRGAPQSRREVAISACRNRQITLTNQRWSYHCWCGHRPPALFDLRADPDETSNVAGEHPDVIGELGERASAFLDEIGAPSEYTEKHTWA